MEISISRESPCRYVRDFYGVPACIGRRVEVGGKPGVIAEDRGNYIGVNFDADPMRDKPRPSQPAAQRLGGGAA